MSPFSSRPPSADPGRRHAPDCFESFELEIQKEADGYKARVASSPVTKTSAIPVGLCSFDPKALDDRAERGDTAARGAETRHARSVVREPADLRAWGKDLFRATFPGELRQVLESSIQKVRSEGKGLRICLRLDEAPELAALPWETLGLDDGEFGGDLDLLVARTLNVRRNRRRRSQTERKKVRMLGLLPRPQGEEELSGAKEWQNLQRLLARAGAGALETRRVDPPTLENLGREIDRAPCHILHVVAHGEPGEPGTSGSLLLESATGEVDVVGGLQLRQALASREPPRLVVLNACFGAAACSDDAFDGLAQSLLRAGVRAVVAMRTEISDAAALTFAEKLYGQLVQGRTLESAMCEARRALAIGEHRTEWATPVLYLQGANERIVDDKWLASLGRMRRIGFGLAAGALLALIGYQLTRQPPPGTPCPATGPPELGLELLWIPGRQLEDAAGEKEKEEPFCISAKEITNRQWQLVTNGGVTDEAATRDLPVTDITVEEVREFARLLRESDPGAIYRLPTGQEWEHAARAGRKSKYWFGTDSKKLHLFGNCRNEKQDGYEGLAPVGSYLPNPWGLYDVHGNAWELVEPDSPLPGRTLRLGGSANNVPGYCHLEYPSEVVAVKDEWTGFRIVRELSIEEQAARPDRRATETPTEEEGK